MGFFGRHFGRDLPDVDALQAQRDVAGLERALGHESLQVVSDAARAIAALIADGDAETQRQAVATGPALVAGLTAVRAAQVSEGEVWRKESALGSLCAAIAQARPPEALALLVALRDSSFSPGLRLEAAEAIAVLSQRGRTEAFRPFFATEPRFSEAPLVAAKHLLELGEDGVGVLRAHACEGSEPLASAVRSALQAVAAPAEVASCEAKEGASGLLRSLDAARVAREEAEIDEQRWHAEQRLAWERSVVRKRVEAFALAAKLATLVGHPEWTAGERLVKAADSRGYDDALAACRARGLPVDEQERVIDSRVRTEMGDDGQPEQVEHSSYALTAAVTLDGETVVIDGGRRERKRYV